MNDETSSNPEALRLQNMRRYSVLDHTAELALDELARLAALVCGMPIGLVSLLGEKEQVFAGRFGVELRGTPRSDAICDYAIRSDQLLEIPDTLADQRTCVNPLVCCDAGLRFYAGMPLRSREGFLIGTICVLDRVPRRLEPEQRLGLELLAKQAMAQLELRVTLRQVEESSSLSRAIVDEAPYAIITTDVNGVIMQFNPAAEQLLGYSAAELVGQATPEVFHDRLEVITRAAELTRELGRVVEPGFDTFVAETLAGRAAAVEWTYIRKDRSRVPVLLRISPLRAAGGKIEGYIGVAHDLAVVDAPAVEPAPRFTRTQVAGAVYGLLAIGTLWVALAFWRRAGVGGWGLPDFVLAGVFVGGVSFVLLFLRQLRECQRLQQEIRERSTVLAEQILTRRSIEADLRRNEGLLRHLFDTTPELIQTVDRRGCILYANRAWRTALGLSEREATGVEVASLIDPGHRALFTQTLRQVFLGERVERIELRFVTKAGSAVQMQCDFSPRHEGDRVVAVTSYLKRVGNTW